LKSEIFAVTPRLQKKKEKKIENQTGKSQFLAV